jgi:hypothetical protein
MGALIMLLVLVARDVREPDIVQRHPSATISQPNQLPKSEPAAGLESSEARRTIPISEVEEALESVEYNIAETEWMAKQFTESKTELEKQLADGEAYLASVEKHTVQLRDEAKRLIEQMKIFEQGEGKREEVDLKSLDQLLKQKIAELDDAEKRLAELRDKLKGKAKSFAVVPYRGRNGTFRIPVYVECKGDKVIIQPEGIELTAQDFLAMDRADNPFDSLLRVARQYYSETGQVERGMEPYPLIIIRPSGIHAFSAAYAAMGNWLKDFGYELVAEDWNMEYPKQNDELRARMEKQLVISRQRLQGYIAAMQIRDGGNNSYTARGVAPNYSSDQNPRNGVGGQNERDNVQNNSYGANPNWQNKGDIKREYKVVDGVAQEVSEPEVVGNSGINSGNRAGANSNLNPADLNSDKTTRPTELTNTETANLANRSDNFRNNNNAGNTSSSDLNNPVVYNRRDVVDFSSGQQGADFNSDKGKGNENPLRETVKKLSPATNAQELPNSKNSDVPSSLASKMPSTSSPMGSDGQPAFGGGQPMPSDSSAASDVSIRAGRVFSSPVRRGIRIHVGSDRFVIVQQTGFEVPRTIMTKYSTKQSIVELVNAISDFVETWGIAGERFYWQPVLKAKILNGGEHQYNELRQYLLNDNKINISIEQE